MLGRSLALVALLSAAACGSNGSKTGQPPPSDVGTPDAPLPEIVAADDWPQFRRDVLGTSASPMVFPADGAARLAEAWSTDVGASTYAQPVVAAAAIYVTTANVGSVVALDVATGATRWTFPFDAPTRADCDERGETHPGSWGSAALLDGVVYAASPDGGLYALDAATGALRFRAPIAAPSPHGELVATSVTLSKALGRAYVGVASTAHCDQIPGRVAAVELATGAVTSRTLVPDGARGAAVWASLSVDEAADLVFVATGNAVGNPAAAPLAQAIVALDARTLEPRGSWQNPTALEDADFGAAPTLFDAGGRKLVAAASKDGWLYVLDRTRLAEGPVWKRELAVTGGGLEGGDPLAGLGSIVAPTFANGSLYVAGGRTPAGAPGAVLALDPATGAVRWSHETPGPVLQPIAATSAVLAVVSAFTADAGAVLELLDAATGARLARFDAGGREGSLAAPSFGAGRVFWSTWDGRLRALEAPP